MEIPMFDVDFTKQGLQVICHEEYKHLIPKILEGLRPYNLTDHFVLFSSGTTAGDLKGYVLSRTALFTNAKAVNDHFTLTSSDVWGLSLPTYHVGGLSVLARAHLLGNKVVDLRQWNPQSWIEKIKEVSITTIVPTQLYDLVKLKLSPPKGLRYIIVGGDLLSSALKGEALKLGWPVIRTFGMSEVSSQLASARSPDSDELEILPIHEVKIEQDRLMVKSQAIFTLEFTLGESFSMTTVQELSDQSGYYITKDRAMMEGNTLKHLGRVGDEYKIAGHLVNLNLLRDQLATFLFAHKLFNQMEFLIEEDVRKGKKLVLLTLNPLEENQLNEISKVILPVKIDEVRVLDSFQRTALGKLKKS
jgi:O-succinylbenzoic acid--CoA ligase